jgi:DNA anti-recombination protein RmuC
VRGLSALRSDFARFADDFQTLGGHLRRAHDKYEDADKRLGRFETKLAAAAEAALPREAAEPAPLAEPDEPEA